MNFSDAPTEVRDGKVFYTRQAEDALVDLMIRENAELLDRLKDQ